MEIDTSTWPTAVLRWPPKWWDGSPVLAFGPFVVERRWDRLADVAHLLRWASEPGLVEYAKTDRWHIFRPVARPTVRGDVIRWRTEQGLLHIRPCRPEDGRLLFQYEGDEDVAAYARRGWDW